MNTTSQNIISSELINRSHQQSQQPTEAAAEGAVAPATKPDTRLPIDSEVRKQNRTLPTPKVLTLLHQQSPTAYRLAEVVGKWIWVTFKEQPTAEIRQQLAQLGFHWNRERQAWQHPCGQFSLSSASDPHEKTTIREANSPNGATKSWRAREANSSYRPASIRRSAKAKTQEAVTA